MKYNSSRKKLKTNKSTLIFGTFFTAATFLILALTASLILSRMKNPLGISGVSSIAVLLFTAAISGFFTAKYKGAHAFLPSVFCAIIFALILFFSGILISGGGVAPISVLNLALFVAIYAVFAILATREKRRVKRR